MKKCPQCHTSVFDAVLTGDCAHEFPSLERMRCEPFGFAKGPCRIFCVNGLESEARAVAEQPPRKGKTMRDKKQHKEQPAAMRIVGCGIRGCVEVFSIVGIVSSLWWILSAITNRFLGFFSDGFNYCEPTFGGPRDRLEILVIGLLVGGAGLYSIATMRDYWSDIPRYKKVIVILSSVADVVLAMLVVFVWIISVHICSWWV
jgi:hypothetical protein